jgi:PAS domain S-box-containing protein
MARMLGFESPEDLIAATTDVGKERYVESERRLDFARILAERGSVEGFTTEVYRRDGSRIWVSVSARAVRDASRALLYYEGTAEDITERKRAEELRESLRRSERMSAMGMLVGGVAHEVRNPLFGISANLDAFEAKAAENRSQFGPVIARIRGEVDRLATVMQALLDYGKPLESALSPEPIDAVLTEAVESCTTLAAQRKVSLIQTIAPSLPSVKMDRKRLVQVFQNLLQNAIQHSPAGGVVVVETEQDTESPWIILRVNDSGVGFPPEDLLRVFEPFYSRRRGGTGLGLAIVQRIVEEHGGTIVAANRRQGGAAVIVRLPPSATAGAQPGRPRG